MGQRFPCKQYIFPYLFRQRDRWWRQLWWSYRWRGARFWAGSGRSGWPRGTGHSSPPPDCGLGHKPLYCGSHAPITSQIFLSPRSCKELFIFLFFFYLYPLLPTTELPKSKAINDSSQNPTRSNHRPLYYPDHACIQFFLLAKKYFIILIPSFANN